MLGKRKARLAKEEAQLDITSFMNLMIVLVPVLLMMMVFSRITVVNLQLPGLEALSEDQPVELEQLEVLVTNRGMQVYFPQGYLVKDIPLLADDGSQDYATLQLTLKQIKQTLLAKAVSKQDIVLLVEDDVPYQTIVSLIDTSRSYKDVVAASVVDAELFPDVSLADAPQGQSTLAAAQGDIQ